MRVVRRVLGWVVLLLGVLVVVAMGWYGAVALFGDGSPPDLLPAPAPATGLAPAPPPAR